MAIEFVKVRMSTGEALESIVSHASKARFGKLSKMLAKVVANSQAGRSLNVELEALHEKTKHSGVKRFLRVLLDEEGDVIKLLDDLSIAMLDERKIKVDAFISKFGQFSGWPIKLAVIGLAVLAAQMLVDIEGLEMLNIPTNIQAVVYTAILVAIFIVMAVMRYRE